MVIVRPLYKVLFHLIKMRGMLLCFLTNLVGKTEHLGRIVNERRHMCKGERFFGSPIVDDMTCIQVILSLQIWCSVHSSPRGKDSTFITVFDPTTYEKKLHYTNLESRVAVILPVEKSVRIGRLRNHSN